MSTPAYIAKKLPDGTYRVVYLHNDGSTVHAGAMLKAHYQDEDKITALLDLGNLSWLDKEISPPEGVSHGFGYGESAPGVCIFYSRDRGDSNQFAWYEDDIEELRREHRHLYVYEDGQWRGYYGRDELLLP